MAPATLFERAETDRQAISDHLDLLQAELINHQTTPLSRTEVESYLQEASDNKRLLVENQKQMRSCAPRGTEMEPICTEFQRLSQVASRLHAGFHGILMIMPPPSTPPPTSTPPTARVPCIKLPPIELVKFSGNLQEWVSFRDVFTTAVHNSSLTKVEKLTQLKALLTGEAARQVRSLVLSDANYDIAWKSLQERYENNRELLFSILKRLISQPVITNGTAASIRTLIDTTKECTRSLEILSIPTQHWDAILLFLLFSKLDASSRELWEQSLHDTSIPVLSKMFEFLEQRARALAASNVPVVKSSARPGSSQPPRTYHSTPQTCKFGCNNQHPYFKCPIFKGQSVPQRLESVKKLKLCINCISSSHLSSSCQSSHVCKLCHQKHHTMLHLEGGTNNTQPPPPACNHVNTPSGVLTTGVLATARIIVASRSSKQVQRAFLDGGSTNSYITESACRKLNLPMRRCDIALTGLQSESVGRAKFITSFVFTPHFSSFISHSVTALVVSSISSSIPPIKLARENWSHLENIELADPDYHLPEPVDVLLGTDVFWSVLENDKITGPPGQPIGIKSSLGWLVAGDNSTTPIRCFKTSIDLDFHLRRFWEQETVLEQSVMSSEEHACEKHFESTHVRDQSGRFTVVLPFRSPITDSSLGSSRQAAVKRFLSLENKYVHQRNIKSAEEARKLTGQWSEYIKFMREYEDLHHMSLIPTNEVRVSSPTYYIPHHSVLKESSTTTKLRVVFDASAPSSNGSSLNDLLMTGPTLQDSLTAIMLRFRIHPVAFTADVEKMYRQIGVIKEQQDLQRIVWREDPSKPLRDYRLTTVTYGTKTAPYLAVKCLRQLAVDEASRFPIAAKIALNDVYVDDAASSCPTLQIAKESVQQLRDLASSGGFQFRKWTSNSQELLETIPFELRETKSLVELQQDTTIKTLGVFWNPSTDKYLFRLNLPPDMPGMYTKRIILSDIAKIYDPLGWLSPSIIVCKIFMQVLWKTKHDWDSILPDEIQQQWLSIKQSLKDLEKLEIPRCVCPHPAVRYSLIGCCDASTKAISACVYLWSEHDNQPPSVFLLNAKTKVAPLKHVTLPRLELCGAELLSELLQSILESLKLPIINVHAFTDSTIAYHWIISEPNKWKIYVRNRVQSIQNRIPMAKWHHIPGERNPADCASRGITAAELARHSLWWTGDQEIFSRTTSTVDLPEEDISLMEVELQAVKSHHLQPKVINPVFTKYSSFGKLQRVIAYVFRFCNNWSRRSTTTPMFKGVLTVHELKTAQSFILRLLQKITYPAEYEVLRRGGSLSVASPLLRLQPFIAADGLLRVGGRLRHAVMPFERKHPVLLPRSHHITNIIIMEIHHQLHHAGATLTQASLQQQYWVINARDAVRFALKRCVVCTRQRAELMKQVMGDLPHHRVMPSRPFSKVGVDYAGPMPIKPMVRSKVSLKCWLALFVCFTTRAVHIEVVSSLTTDCFIAALRRFTSRRGKPTDIFSDCGTNFKGTDKVLREFSLLSTDPVVQTECSSQGIDWHFNPAGAPHFGGLWEAGIKSLKYHLKRVMGSFILTYEEMLTLVVQIEGILNSRPIVPASSDPSDLTALTPAHFLIGAAITAVPETCLMDKRETHLQRWQRIQQQQQIFWKRWSNEYVSRLQQRPKWWKISPNLEPGNMVIIKDERLPPLKWKLGRVISVHPGADGLVRVASLRTADGEIKRPVVKLCLLPTEAN